MVWQVREQAVRLRISYTWDRQWERKSERDTSKQETWKLFLEKSRRNWFPRMVPRDGGLLLLANNSCSLLYIVFSSQHPKNTYHIVPFQLKRTFTSKAIRDSLFGSLWRCQKRCPLIWCCTCKKAKNSNETSMSYPDSFAIKQILSSPTRMEQNPIWPLMTFNPTSPQPGQVLTDGACPWRNSVKGTWYDCVLAPDGVLWAGTVDLTSATLRSWWRSDLFLPLTRNSEQETKFLRSKIATNALDQHLASVICAFPSLPYIHQRHTTKRMQGLLRACGELSLGHPERLRSVLRIRGALLCLTFLVGTLILRNSASLLNTCQGACSRMKAWPWALFWGKNWKERSWHTAFNFDLCHSMN